MEENAISKIPQKSPRSARAFLMISQNQGDRKYRDP